jgi:hypothetical protein
MEEAKSQLEKGREFLNSTFAAYGQKTRTKAISMEDLDLRVACGHASV